MKVIVTILLAAVIVTGFAVQSGTYTSADKKEVVPDSVGVWQVQHLIESELVARLEGKAGLEATWSQMDKSGHRNKIFPNAGYDFENKTANGYIRLNEKGEVFGDVVRLDGTLRSHVCSFKISYPDEKIMVRKSALDKWEDVVSFTGVKTVKLRKNEFPDR